MLVILVGPKGSGKSHIGRTLERALGVHFFHVEPLWMAYYAECEAGGRAPSIAEGISVVHPRIAEALRTHEHVCVETTGASREILNGLVSLAPPAKALVVRVAAPLDLCLERIRSRDQTNQIPTDIELVRRMYALSAAARIRPAFTIETTGLSDDEIVSRFRDALTGLCANDSSMSGTDISDAWDRGDAYERYVGRWSRRVAPRFLSWLGIPAERRWLDVGCGTGALCAAILERCSPSSVAGVEPSEGFLTKARENLGTRVALHQGSGTAIPLDDASADVVVSGLVLNFIPDPRAALAEMARVTAAGGTIAAYVWDYAGRMELIRIFWDAVVELDPDAAHLDEGVRFPMCNRGALAELFGSAGLSKVEVEAIDIDTPFASFEDYWQPFLGGQGPAPGYVMSLSQEARARLRERIRERLPVKADGSISLVARAWAACGTLRK